MEGKKEKKLHIYHLFICARREGCHTSLLSRQSNNVSEEIAIVIT